MAWRKTAAVVTLAVAPTFAAISGAMADQRQHHYGDASDEQPLGVAVSASSSDAAWIASQLHQPRFAARRDQPVMSLPRDSRADANAMPDGPHVNGLRSDGEPTRVVAVAERYRSPDMAALRPDRRQASSRCGRITSGLLSARWRLGGFALSAATTIIGSPKAPTRHAA